MPIDSLVEMAQRACMKYSQDITDIGPTPYELLRPILLKIRNAEQLHNLEINSPQIVGKDAEIWLNMIKRDIPNYESKPHQPSDPKNWYKVYRKLKKDADREMAAGDDKLQAALKTIQQTKEAKLAPIVHSGQLPSLMGKKRRSTFRPSYNRGEGTSHLTVMQKIRKETRGASSSRMNRPMHELQNRSTVVKKAPESFVRDIKNQALTKLPIHAAREAMGQTNIRPPRPPQRDPESTYNLTRDREARLRALKSGKQPESRRSSSGSEAAVNNLTLDFLEDDDDDDDLFDDRSGPKKAPPRIGMRAVKPHQKRKRSDEDLFTKERNDQNQSHQQRHQQPHGHNQNEQLTQT